MIFLVLSIVVLLSFGWDAYAVKRWPDEDMTVSGIIYRFDHAEPIVSAGMGAFVAWLYMTGDVLSGSLALALLIHTNWNA